MIRIRDGRSALRRIAVLILATLLLAPVVDEAQQTSVAAATGGRITLNDVPIRYFDSRSSGTSQIQTLPPGVVIDGLVKLYISDATSTGQAFIFPCGGSRGSDPNFAFQARWTIVFTVVGNNSCLELTTPAVVILEHIGQVGASATATGLQYQPLAAPRKVFEGGPASAVERASQVSLTGKVDVPATARAVVALIEVTNPGVSGFSNLSRLVSNAPAPGVQCAPIETADVVFTTGQRAASLAYLPIDPAKPGLCVYNSGWQVDPAMITRVTIVGFLVTDGIDSSRLPPTMILTDQLTDPPGLQSLPPKRLLDTREPTGPTAGAKVQGGSYLELTVPQATAYTVSAVLNVTVVDPDMGGFLTVYPCDSSLPVVSNLNYEPRDVVPNQVNVKLSVTRTVCFYAQRTTHLVVDISGTFEKAGGAGVSPIVPTRLLDTRVPIGVQSSRILASGEVVELQVAGANPDIPSSGIAAVTMNVTVDAAAGPGYVSVYPCDQALPTVSNLNFVRGDIVPNLVTVRLSPTGTACFYVSNSTHLVADLTAWYNEEQSDGFTPLVPQRFLDTRSGLGTSGSGKVPAESTLRLQVAGRGKVPANGATAVAVNVTAVEPTGPGFATVFPCDAKIPGTSNLNFQSGDIVPNSVVTKLAQDGTICIYSTATVDLLVDVAGYFTKDPEIVKAPLLSP